ncbi:hypothetical protein BH10PSE17_BH10PSE17_03260 [soil metagenome]
MYSLLTSIHQVRPGKLKALAVTTLTRSPLLPDVPTVSESGLTGFEASVFNGFLAAAATPPDILQRMNAELGKVTRDRGYRDRLSEQGSEAIASESYGQFNT